MNDVLILNGALKGATSYLQKFFSMPNPDDNEIKKARIAEAFVSDGVGAFRAQTSRDNVRLKTAEAISENKADLAKFLKVSKSTIRSSRAERGRT